MSNTYRYDNRDENQFKKDIKENHTTELDIAVRLCIYQYNLSGKYPTLTPTGIDFKGDLIKDSNKVGGKPDFKIGKTFVEITHADTLCKRYFHMKIPKVDRCSKGEYKIIFVNAYKSDKPVFVILSENNIDGLAKKSRKKYGEVSHPGRISGVVPKKALRFDIGWFDNWAILPDVTDDIPKEYRKILNEIQNNKG